MMKKKQYEKPTIQVIKLQQLGLLLQTSAGAGLTPMGEPDNL